MISVPALLQLARADFLERIRRHSFLVTLGFAIFAAYMFLPPNHATYSTLHFAGHRGLYGSAWVGGVIAMLTTTFLGLAGFYLVRNAIERDRRTGVGQILAATPLPTPLYLLAKLASNFAVLAAMVVVVAGAAAVMQLVRGEDTQLRPLELLAPFVVLTLPVMVLVAALAVVFEVTPGLRGGLGNVVYSPGSSHKRGKEALTSQLIPLDPELHRVENYSRFVDARRKLLADAINGFIGRVGVEQAPA